MPTVTRSTRVKPAGTMSGRPMREAAAVVTMEPATRPAGNPAISKATPPTAPTARVSAVRGTTSGRGRKRAMRAS
jgi:hypothetical protein